MKITPKELQDVLDYIGHTPMTEQTLAKMTVLDYLMKCHSELTEEEKETFPIEVVADLRFADFCATVIHFANEGQIESLKTFISEDLAPADYRCALPFYRAKYAYLNAVGCLAILDNTTPECEADRDLWIYRGLNAVDSAIELFGRMEETEEACTALKVKTQILMNKSYKEAAESAITGIQVSPNNELRQEFVKLWKDITDKRFDLYYELTEASFINQLPLSQEKISKMREEDSSIGRFAEQCLCAIEPNYDRSPMLFVKNIEDVADPEIEELVENARYIFCLDRIPPELHFDKGHPKANILYEVDDEDTTLYHELKEDEEN